MKTDNDDKKQVTADQREFNLMDYKELEVDFKGCGYDFTFKFFGSADTDGANADLYSISQCQSFAHLPVPMKAAAQKLEADITIAEGECFNVKFNLDDQPLFIVRVDTDDEMVICDSYDLAGKEITSLSIWKPEAAKLESTLASRSNEAAPVDAITPVESEVKTLSVSQLLESSLSMDYIYGDLERVVDEVVSGGRSCADDFLRLLRLIQQSDEDARAVLLEKMSDYACASSKGAKKAQAQYIESLFEQPANDEKGGDE